MTHCLCDMLKPLIHSEKGRLIFWLLLIFVTAVSAHSTSWNKKLCRQSGMRVTASSDISGTRVKAEDLLLALIWLPEFQCWCSLLVFGGFLKSCPWIRMLTVKVFIIFAAIFSFAEILKQPVYTWKLPDQILKILEISSSEVLLKFVGIFWAVNIKPIIRLHNRGLWLPDLFSWTEHHLTSSQIILSMSEKVSKGRFAVRGGT